MRAHTLIALTVALALPAFAMGDEIYDAARAQARADAARALLAEGPALIAGLPAICERAARGWPQDCGGPAGPSCAPGWVAGVSQLGRAIGPDAAALCRIVELMAPMALDQAATVGPPP